MIMLISCWKFWKSSASNQILKPGSLCDCMINAALLRYIARHFLCIMARS